MSRQAGTVFYCEHSKNGIRLAFYKDHCQLLGRWMSWVRVAGRCVIKNDKTSKKKKKKDFCVGVQVRDDVAMKLETRSQFKRN